MFFDSHAHLDDGRFNDDRAQIFAELAQHGVSGLMNIGCDGASSPSSMPPWAPIPTMPTM